MAALVAVPDFRGRIETVLVSARFLSSSLLMDKLETDKSACQDSSVRYVA
jgi:hypothetical protein